VILRAGDEGPEAAFIVRLAPIEFFLIDPQKTNAFSVAASGVQPGDACFLSLFAGDWPSGPVPAGTVLQPPRVLGSGFVLVAMSNYTDFAIDFTGFPLTFDLLAMRTPNLRRGVP